MVLHGETLAEAAAHAHDLALREGLVFIHPYDDPGVIAGQGTMALEMLEDAPELDTLVIPVGGGGLCAGCAASRRALRPGHDRCSASRSRATRPWRSAWRASRSRVGGPTIAEGIAVRDVGELPLAILPRAAAIEVLVVPEARGRDRRSPCWPRARRWWPKAPARRAWRPC